MCRPHEDYAETMTVAELIEELKKHDPDALIYMDDGGTTVLPLQHLQ